VGGQCHALAALPSGKRPGTHCTGSWVGPLGQSGWVQKILTPLGFDPWTKPTSNYIWGGGNNIEGAKE